MVAQKFLQMDLEKENAHIFLKDCVVAVCEERV